MRRFEKTFFQSVTYVLNNQAPILEFDFESESYRTAAELFLDGEDLWGGL